MHFSIYRLIADHYHALSLASKAFVGVSKTLRLVSHPLLAHRISLLLRHPNDSFRIVADDRIDSIVNQLTDSNLIVHSPWDD